MSILSLFQVLLYPECSPPVRGYRKACGLCERRSRESGATNQLALGRFPTSQSAAAAESWALTAPSLCLLPSIRTAKAAAAMDWDWTSAQELHWELWVVLVQMYFSLYCHCAGRIPLEHLSLYFFDLHTEATVRIIIIRGPQLSTAHGRCGVVLCKAGLILLHAHWAHCYSTRSWTAFRLISFPYSRIRAV